MAFTVVAAYYERWWKLQHVTENHGVGGSIPPLGTILFNNLLPQCLRQFRLVEAKWKHPEPTSVQRAPSGSPFPTRCRRAESADFCGFQGPAIAPLRAREKSSTRNTAAPSAGARTLIRHAPWNAPAYRGDFPQHLLLRSHRTWGAVARRRTAS